MPKQRELKEKRNTLVSSTTRFCDERLNDEYKELCIHTINKLYRKKQSPLETGNLEIWAAAIVYSLGSTNQLFKKNNPFQVGPNTITLHFKTSLRTVQQKALEIKKILKMTEDNEEFYVSASKGKFYSAAMGKTLRMILKNMSKK